MNRLSFLKGAAVAAVIPAAAVAAAVPASAAGPLHKFGRNMHGTMPLAGPGVTHRGGVIRFTPSGPELHVNDAHNSVGIIPSSIRINEQGNLELLLDCALPVVSTFANADETMGARDLAAGISGGVRLCIIYISKGGRRLNLKNSYNAVMGETSNIWIGVNSFAA